MASRLGMGYTTLRRDESFIGMKIVRCRHRGVVELVLIRPEHVCLVVVFPGMHAGHLSECQTWTRVSECALVYM